MLSLTARGLTTGEIAAHFAEVYGAQVSKDSISRITNKVVEEMTDWQNRPLDRVYRVIFIDAIVVKIRDGPRPRPTEGSMRSTTRSIAGTCCGGPG